jgi:hypothetical protein
MSAKTIDDDFEIEKIYNLQCKPSHLRRWALRNIRIEWWEMGGSRPQVPLQSFSTIYNCRSGSASVSNRESKERI